MADVGTPSAMAMGTVNAGADTGPASDTKSTSKPDKPDDAAFKEAEAKKKNDFEAAKKRTQDADAKLNASKSNNKDSPSGQRQAQLKSELAEIRSKQSTNKSSRTGVQDRIAQLDQKLKVQIQEQKDARAKLPFKSVEDLESHIKRLEDEVNSGKMRIVDEKKNLENASQLRSKKKQFTGVDNIQKNIDALKQQISEVKKELDNPEIKALSAQYDERQSELNTLRGEQDSQYKNRDSNRDAWRAAKDEQSRVYNELKAMRDEYYATKRAYDNWEREARKQLYQRRDNERKARDLEYKKRKMEQELEEAREPAFLAEINACNSVMRLLDPSSAPEAKGPLMSSKFGASAQRTVEDSEMKGTRLSKKDDDEENYFIGGAGKKGKKGKKAKAVEGGAPGKSTAMGVFYSPGVAEQFDSIGVKQPASVDDQPRVLEEVKEKKKFYQDNQAKKTQENVAAVQKKFDALEAAEANGSASQSNGTVASGAKSSTVESAVGISDPRIAGEADGSAGDVPNGANGVAEDLSKTSISETKGDEAALVDGDHA